jgi:hypothetical protein
MTPNLPGADYQKLVQREYANRRRHTTIFAANMVGFPQSEAGPPLKRNQIKKDCQCRQSKDYGGT